MRSDATTGRRLRGFDVACTLAMACVVVAGPLRAQDKSTYYTVRNPGEFQIDWKAFYDRADEMTAAARRALPHALDLAYGPAAKQKLDVYRPAGTPQNAPVLVFLHGGGFREGDRAHYGYVAVPFAEQGIVTVVPSYRLTPEARFPDQPRDVVAVLGWIGRNIRSHGGDPRRVYLAGHSAGAILTATICAEPRWREEVPDVTIRGCIPISGSYDLRRLEGTPGYVGSPSDAEAASPVLRVRPTPPPAIVALGSLEERYMAPSRAFVDAVRSAGGRADLLVLDGQAHDGTAAALGEPGGALMKAILELIKAPATPGIGGVWRYRTLARAGSPEVPVTGMIGFVEGYFVQQSVNAGDPFDRQLFQAHAGTYRSHGHDLTLVSTVGLLVDPAGDRAVESRQDAQHRVRAGSVDGELTLTFGTGTVQRLTASPMPRPDVVVLSRGVLLLGGDGRFSLTAESERGAVAGWGRYARDGQRLALDAERWLRLDGSRPAYFRDLRVDAVLTDRTLTLPAALSFSVERRLPSDRKRPH